MAAGRVGRRTVVVCLAVLAACAPLGEVRAYIEVPMTLGAIIGQSSNIVYLEVERVDSERNVLHFRKVADLKGRHPTQKVEQHIGQQGFQPREWQTVMKWARPGQTAVLFHNGGASETCIDNYWFQCYGGGSQWRMSHAEPYLSRSFAGRPERLRQIVEQVERGEEAIAPCLVDADKEDLQTGRARVQRLRVSRSRLDYDPQRDFVGWGGGELEELRGMPGFSHLSLLPRIGPFAIGASTVDYDGDGRLDVLLFGESRLALARNEEKSFVEVELPAPLRALGGARSAAWADHDGDGRLDLLLATARGPRLFATEVVAGKAGGRSDAAFRDAGARLAWSDERPATAAAWIDANEDGWPDVLVASGLRGVRLLVNETDADGGRRFREHAEIALPDDVFRGATSASGGGDHLVLGDVDGDGATDALYCAGKGLLLRARADGAGFDAVTDCGITLDARGVGPAFGDADGDGDLDLFAPSGRFGRLWLNDGHGRFHDGTARLFATMLFAPMRVAHGRPSSAAWGDFDSDGRADLVVSYLGGANRLFVARGERFEDATVAYGLDRRVFQTQSASFADFDQDGDLDLAFVNEAGESTILLGAGPPDATRVPVDLVLPVDRRAIGAKVRVRGDESNGAGALAAIELGVLAGRGSQSARPRLSLWPGVWHLEVSYAGGERREQRFEVAQSHLVVEVER